MPLFNLDVNTENRALAAVLAGTVLLTAILAATRLDFDPAPADNPFRVEQPEEINRVQLRTAADTVDLAFAGARWQLAGRYAADRRMIKVFFATLAQAQPLRMVAGAEADSAKSWLRRSGVHVSLYRQGRPAADFHAGGNPTKTISYFLSDNGAVYAMHIPGYRVYVSAIFEAPRHTWREKRLFDFNWQNFRSLQMRPADGAPGFEVTFNGKTFGIKDMDADTAKLHAYLDEVSLMAAEEHYQPGPSAAFDSLLATPPAFEILVGDVAGNTYRLEVFRPAPGQPAIPARINGDAVLLPREKGAALARRRSYFVRSR
jgi:hypothetical protein